MLSTNLIFLVILDSGLDTGALLTDAYDTLKQLKDDSDVVALVEFYNYANYSLSGNNNYIESGTIREFPMHIHQGEKEGFLIRGEGDGKGVEAIVSYTLPGDYRFFIYVKVSKSNEKSHQLGVCTAIGNWDDNWGSDWYSRMKSGSCLNIHENYKNNPRMLQCCIGVLCAQVTMTTHYQANLAVKILPRNAEHFAVDLSEDHDPEYYVHQDNLNHILDNENTCKHPVNGTHAPPIAGTASTKHISVPILLFSFILMALLNCW